MPRRNRRQPHPSRAQEPRRRLPEITTEEMAQSLVRRGLASNQILDRPRRDLSNATTEGNDQ
jgi:hypothetical protein